MRALSRLHGHLRAPTFLVRTTATGAGGAARVRSLLARSVWKMGNDEWRATAANGPAVVFYHYPCPDGESSCSARSRTWRPPPLQLDAEYCAGVFAALAASMFFEQQGVQTRFYPFEVYREPHIQAMQLQVCTQQHACVVEVRLSSAVLASVGCIRTHISSN